MRQIQPDLWETEAEYPAPGLITHAYLLTREDGNVLFYNTGHHHEIEAMALQGGVDWQFLSHQDELGDSLWLIREQYGTKLGGHILEREAFEKVCVPDILLDKREWRLGNIEVIPAPGHTPGSTCFLVESAYGKRYLFTGDTLFLNQDAEWTAGYLKGYSELEPLADSLRMLRELRPDVVISSACPGGVGYREIAADTWAAEVDGALVRMLDAEGA